MKILEKVKTIEIIYAKPTFLNILNMQVRI